MSGRRALDGYRVHEVPQTEARRRAMRVLYELAAQVAAHVPLYRTVDPVRDLAEMMRVEAAATLKRP